MNHNTEYFSRLSEYPLSSLNGVDSWKLFEILSLLLRFKYVLDYDKILIYYLAMRSHKAVGKPWFEMLVPWNVGVVKCWCHDLDTPTALLALYAE